jgi:hypothetical protein
MRNERCSTVTWDLKESKKEFLQTDWLAVFQEPERPQGPVQSPVLEQEPVSA